MLETKKSLQQTPQPHYQDQHTDDQSERIQRISQIGERQPNGRNRSQRVDGKDQTGKDQHNAQQAE